MDNTSLERFTTLLCGSYTNKEQASKNPRNFAHINMYFVPLKWKGSDSICLYSEQSYDYSPWMPYRQSINFISQKDKLFILSNFGLVKPERYAGAGHHNQLLSQLSSKNITRRKGCDMYFEEQTIGKFNGYIEPGEKCIVLRNGKKTFVESRVVFDGQNLRTIDQGIDIVSRRKIWGAEHGELIFKKILSSINPIDIVKP